MTINEQLHGSATHKKGFDPNCPKCKNVADKTDSGLPRPKAISCWTWYDTQHHMDLALWQNCLLAVHEAGTEDVKEVAEKKYDALGGRRSHGLSRRAIRQLKTGVAKAEVSL